MKPRAWHEDQENRTNYANERFWPIQSGEAEGAILGGSYGCLNMLQGTAYFPPLNEAILFREHSAEGKATQMGLDCALSPIKRISAALEGLFWGDLLSAEG